MADRRRRLVWGSLAVVLGGLAILVVGDASMPADAPAATPAPVVTLAPAATPAPAPLPGRPTRPPGAPPVVAVVGDSIMHDLLAGPPTDAALADTHLVWRTSVPGATVGDLLDEAAALVADTDADVVVLEVGTNDALQAADGLSWARSARALARVDELVAEVPCVVVVTVDQGLIDPAAGVRARQVDGWWAARAARDPGRYQLADWSAFVAAGGGAGVWTTDGVHPTLEGAAAMAELVGQAVDRCPSP